MIHTRELFKAVVDVLNRKFLGRMTFELAGSLAQTPASQHDADIIVYPHFPISLSALTAGFRSGGAEILAVDRTSTIPFPGRTQGQDRVQAALPLGMVVDLFFPKGALVP